MIFKSNKEKYFSEEEAVDLMVLLSPNDANSEKKWRGFYNSLSKTELEEANFEASFTSFAEWKLNVFIKFLLMPLQNFYFYFC